MGKAGIAPEWQVLPWRTFLLLIFYHFTAIFLPKLVDLSTFWQISADCLLNGVDIGVFPAKERRYSFTMVDPCQVGPKFGIFEYCRSMI